MYNQITSNKRKTWLLMILFIGLISVIGWVFSRTEQFGYGSIVAAGIFSLIMVMFSYYSGDKVALWTAGARPISKAENPSLYRVVENLCITTGLPLPKIHIINDPAPNAFATGRDPQHSSIAVTTGLMNMLENEELEGVISHELSHIKNFDIRVMTTVIVLVGMIALLSDFFLRFSLFGRNRDRENNSQAGAILMIIGIILAILSPFIAQLIQLAVSRRREYLADASGALITRFPDGLATALQKIATYKQPLRSANTATAHLYIANPFGSSRRVLTNLFSTHPPIEERIKKLKEMALS